MTPTRRAIILDKPKTSRNVFICVSLVFISWILYTQIHRKLSHDWTHITHVRMEISGDIWLLNNTIPAEEHNNHNVRDTLIEYILKIADNVQHSTVQTETSVIYSMTSEALKHAKKLSDEDDKYNVPLFLFWSKWWKQNWWSLPPTSLVDCWNPHGTSHRCFFTHDEAFLDDSDALFFHLRGTDLQSLKFPSRKQTKDKYWILNSKEPPIINVGRTPQMTSVWRSFNLTSSHVPFSDVTMMYGRCAERTDDTVESNIDFSVGKTGLAAWFVGHCNVGSRRDNYVRELMKYMPVDVFGGCLGSKKVCERFTTGHGDCNKSISVINSHKFYLAFENSFCESYITEKAFRTLTPGMFSVPIVYGMGNYTNVLPPKSYINAADFETARHLADYILKLDSDNDLYNEYFYWRQSYTCKHILHPCAVCESFHEIHKGEHLFEEDHFGKVFSDESCSQTDDLQHVYQLFSKLRE